MGSAQQDFALRNAMAAEIQGLKELPESELVALGEKGRSRSHLIGGKAQEIKSWSEPVAHEVKGVCVVIVGAWTRGWFGFTKHHMLGFVVESDRHYSDMSDSDLWHYD